MNLLTNKLAAFTSGHGFDMLAIEGIDDYIQQLLVLSTPRNNIKYELPLQHVHVL